MAPTAVQTCSLQIAACYATGGYKVLVWSTCSCAWQLGAKPLPLFLGCAVTLLLQHVTAHLYEMLCACDEVSEGVLLVEVLAVLQPAQGHTSMAAVAWRRSHKDLEHVRAACISPPCGKRGFSKEQDSYSPSITCKGIFLVSTWLVSNSGFKVFTLNPEP